MRLFLFLAFLCVIFLLLPAGGSAARYKTRNPELGIVYTPDGWDKQQWERIFQDPGTPVGWAMLPVGHDSCNSIPSWWISGARSAGLRLGIVLDPFLNEGEIKNTIDCAASLGIKRVVLDEYIVYQTKTNHRPLCPVISELRSIYDHVRKNHPGIQFGYDDNWQTWIATLGRDQSNSCGSYPYFQADFTGISVLSKYSNPSQGNCGHPTIDEMIEQLIDLKPTVKDYSKSGKIFVWQLNQHWYPGGGEVLQFYRQMKRIYGWQRFFLWGPTASSDLNSNWAYTGDARRDGCFATGYQWYLPARDYLIRISEGQKTSIQLNAPESISLGSSISVHGMIKVKTGVHLDNVQLQFMPPAGSAQSFTTTVTAPSNAHAALVGVRINTQTGVRGNASFRLDRAQLFETGSSRNLVSNSDFNDGLSNWIIISTVPVDAVTNGGEKSLQASCSTGDDISITSLPILIRGGRSYTVRFDAGLFQESRNNGYFFVAWTNFNEIRRDRLRMNWPVPATILTTSSDPGGNFHFDWQPSDHGVYRLFGFFPGTRQFQPSISEVDVAVN